VLPLPDNEVFAKWHGRAAAPWASRWRSSARATAQRRRRLQGGDRGLAPRRPGT